MIICLVHSWNKNATSCSPSANTLEKGVQKGDIMNKEEKLKILQTQDEKTLTKKFVIPLFESKGMGYKNIQYTHKKLEFGRDVVCYKENEFGVRIYTGIQVKRIKITTSKVDTILRQIHEAFGESFTDLSDNKKKELDKVVLVTSREFTEDAKESLRAILKSANWDRVVTVIDGRKLIDLIDMHLNKAFWREYDYFDSYFKEMKKEFEIIKDVAIIGHRESIRLEDIHVSLQLVEKNEREIPASDKNDRIGEKYREKQFGSDDILREFDKVVVVGAPGSGKTTLLKHLALKFCEQSLESHQKIIVPIFITLGQFSRGFRTLRDYIDVVFEQFGFPHAGKVVEKHLKEGNCLLLLDGLDEIISRERQQRITADIEEFIQMYGKNKYIITSRVTGYHHELKEFKKLELLEYNDQQIRQFITNWFGSTNPEKARLMNKTIMENDKIRAIARNPLMITIIAVMYEEERELPQRRTELYSKCAEILLRRWDVAHQIKNKYEAKAKEKILRKLALEAYALKKKSFSKEEVLRIIREYLPEVRISKMEAEDLMDEILKRNGLLKETINDEYCFLNFPFQEYFAALEVRGRRDYETLLQHWYEPWWEEVVLLFVGFDRDATELIMKVREIEKKDDRFKEDISYHDLTLLGKCIADADYTNVAITDQIVKDLWLLYREGEFSSSREKAIGILALIKPKIVVDLLVEGLKNKDSDFREKALEALGRIGSEKAVEPLICLLTNKDVDVRWWAAEALVRIGSEKAVEPLICLLTNKDGDVRWWAAFVLGEIRSEKAVEPLIYALKDENSSVRGKAAEALGRIGSEKAVEP